MRDVPTVAPLFELPTSDGAIRTLSGLLEQGRVLLVFHRGTW
jgi:peroxiredoxin